MPYVTWNETYSVGIPQLDSDHRTLIEMMNTLHAAMTSGQSKSVMTDLIKNLKKYALEHFKHEEDYLLKTNDPHFKEQKEQHSAFAVKVNEFEGEFNKGNLVLAMKIMPFLNDWLINHIMRMDKTYAKKKGLFS